ncbi:Meckel syndrome type 1 protein [Variovorax sp. OK605]|uniref:hypothetical protein n=1 Tax=Variovorax sp. OK605 TaxID=1855317 RepID=UPI0008EC9585|nr:hypothetical protein [Variovorax sp. OK605]SFP97593.1 Meckel syndrome type 1 protein [Variovorax sp. OK605]
MSGNTTGFDNDNDRDRGDDLRDPALRRALDHAPDRDAAPDPRTRDAILKMAHNLAAAPMPASGAAANSASVLPWWRRLFGGGEPRSRMPWNAAFATVLVAAFVTVLWRSEPVPEARLDGEARVGGAASPAAQAPAASSAPAAPAAATAPEPAPPPSAAAKQAPAAAPTPATPAPAIAAEQRAKALREAASAKETERAQPSRKQAAPAPAAVAPEPPAIVAEQSAPAPAQDERREARVESERQRAYAAPAVPAAPVAPVPAAAPPPAIAAAPLARQSQDASALASQGGSANAQASGALRDSAPRAAKAAPLQAAVPSSFSALERWTSFSSGAGARRARGDVEGLAALVGTVARSATAPDASLDAPVEARLSLYRGDTLVAVLEIAGDQVRWTPQPGGTARVGTPPAQALDALRSLLAR